MEGKPYRGTRGGAKNRKKKFYEARDKLRELLRKLAKRWGVDFVLPRIECVEGAPAVVTTEEADWDVVDSLDVLSLHVLAAYVPDLQISKRCLTRLALPWTRS